MRLSPPFFISSRLMPAIKIAGATISLNLGPRDSEGRVLFDSWIDLPDGSEHHITDHRSGCRERATPDLVQKGFKSLLSFLSACGQSSPDGENADLFNEAIGAWAQENSDEIGMMSIELEERPDLIV